MNIGDQILVIEPGLGSSWGRLERVVGNHVEYTTWDSGGVGSPYLPADYMGEAVLLNAPKTCILKVLPPH